MTNSNRSGVHVLAVVGDLNGGPICRIKRKCAHLASIKLVFLTGKCSTFPPKVGHVVYAHFMGHRAWNAAKGIPYTHCQGGVSSICRAIEEFAGGPGRRDAA